MEGAGRVGRVSGSGTGTLFHPCVVLLLDDEGRQIGRHLADLLACLPSPVRAWVELVDAAGVSGPDARSDFDSSLAAALARVTNVHLREGVRRAGYRVGEAMPLVLLAGHTTARTLHPAARVAQRVAARDFPRALRIALLCDTRPTDQVRSVALDDQARKQDWDALVGWAGSEAAGAAEPPVALCLLYQDYDERSWHWNAAPAGSGQPAAGVVPALEPEDVRYAVAEAAFALIASGLTDEAQFRERLRLTMPTVPGGGGEAGRRFATLATARLAFPRAQAEVACASYEGAELLEAWVRDAERYEEAQAGRGGRAAAGPGTRFIRALRDAIEDCDEPPYLRVGLASPPLSADGVSRLYGFDRTQADPARVFATFGRREVGRERSATGARLADALEVLNDRARVRYRRWHEALAEVWGDDRARRERAIAERVERDLPDGPSGLARTRAYLREVRQALILMRERQEDCERFRGAAFASYLRKLSLEVAGVGDLTPRPAPAPLAPAAPAPAVHRAPAALDALDEVYEPDAPVTLVLATAVPPTVDAMAAAAGGAVSVDTAALGAWQSTTPPEENTAEAARVEAAAFARDPTEMPERLVTLAGALARTLSVHDDLLASGATVIAALVMLLPLLVYAAVALASMLPLHLPVLRLGAGQVPLNAVLMSLVLAVVVAVPPALIFRQRIEHVRRLRRMLVGLYVRWWAEICGRDEDALRREHIEALARAVDERLAAVAEFEDRLRTAAARLRAQAAAVDRELESGPASRRDVFVVGGRRFPALRLDGLYETVRAHRAADPLDPAHASDASLGAALRERLRAGAVPLLLRDVDDLAAQAAEFGAEVCRPYLTGDLVTVTPALHLGVHDDDVERVALGTLFERATPLFRPLATDSPRRAKAVAAPSDITLVEGLDQAAGVSHVVTPSGEWLIVAQLVSDGRPRWWRRSIIERTARVASQSRRNSRSVRDELSPAAAPEARAPVSRDTI